MKLDSKLFDRIRISPPVDEVPENAPLCEWQGCGRPGTYRAPKGRLREGQYFGFCLDHVRDYNKSYNYFAGMGDAEIDSFRQDAAVGHRPTWTMGARSAAGARADAWSASFRSGYRAYSPDPEPSPERRPLRELERRSFATLDLDGGETASEIKARYKLLVKRLHPDANGGDRSFEDRLREIIQAYNHLKASGFC